MAVIIIVVIVPSSSCTRHCISSLFINVARIQKCIWCTHICEPITSGGNNNNNNGTKFDASFNRSFSGYRITIHEDNTILLVSPLTMHSKMRCSFRILLCVFFFFMLWNYNSGAKIENSISLSEYKENRLFHIFFIYRTYFWLLVYQLLSLLILSLLCSSKC